jgi:alpha-1,3-glucan synthase
LDPVLWILYVLTLLQPYGRNWSFLWSVPIPKWAIMLLIILFFIGVWALMLYILTSLSRTHTWLLPVFAVGLGAPRWCQV